MSRLCGVCHRRLPDGEALVLHLETHMEKNSTFKCDQCDKSFVHAKSLYVHKRNHSGVRPYTCQYCFKTFRHWHKHRVHVRIHTGERPYQCEVCGWGFPRNDERKRHMRTHVGRKAFHCIDCGVGCGTQVALMRHVEIHHGKGKRASGPGPAEASEEPADAASPAGRSDEEAEGEPEDTADENFDDLDEQITVKIEMDGAAGVADDGDEDSDDPPYQPCSSESESDADAAPAVARALQPEVGVEVNAEPARDPIATDEQVQSRAGSSADGAGVVVKEEPPDAEQMDEGPTRDPWGSEDSELDDDRARLLEPEVNLTEMFIDIERMRSTIRRKIAANAHKFDDAVTLKARSFVRDPEPNIDHMRSILRAKLEEGKRIQQLLRQNEADKRRLQADIERGRKRVKLEPTEADGGAESTPIFVSKTVPSVRLRRLSETSRTDVSRRWMSSRLSAEGGEPGRTSDPSATPRTPRRRWIQHRLNFAPDDGAIVAQETPAGLRMSTGFGQL
ncbi:zinc finger protein 668-like [Pollicipes pollicipes]|uniref:zinc finger protein 668-like n=1 Tax=Pollicipes pollicipes TaxID=41117 RepID=UPI0018852EED|nr:zinc finger protein 668-like [Pollicipes pollicipes]